ncbi:MAG: hypothetical protein LUH11_02460 [Candidatus Gastranaerophilales bacterium]|nr:hypothetical protein [Candidatus Gastranaerophilales bacterium]
MCLITALATALGTSAAAVWSGAIGAAATLASTAVGVYSSVQQGNAQKAQYEYQAQIAKQNAQIAQNNADQKRQEGIEESRLQRMKTLQAVGSQQAAMAANGIDVSSGTALDIVEDTAAMGELDALTTRYNYETQALAYEQEANNYNNQSNLDTFAAQNAYKSGITNAVATGFNGLADTTNVASKWYSGNSTSLSSSKSSKNGTVLNGGYYGGLNQ